MNTQEIMTMADANLLHAYNRFPIAWDHAQGVYLYDAEGKKYLDFASGIAVMALGYGNKEYTDALKAQIDRIMHTSNLFYSEPTAKAAAAFTKASGMDRVFFTNSGAEAIDGAIKTARKYAYLKDGTADHEIIAMNHSFHGRTFGALSVTGTKKYRDPFEPMIGNVKFADFNDIDSVRAQLSDRTCAIIVEPIQGEGGMLPAEESFIKGLDEIRKEKDILLIFDEIQCGMGRSGEMFAFMHYGVTPDILTSAKALGCGVPVGAFAMTQHVADHSIVPGDHGSTYGGNPFVCAAVCKVFELFEKYDLTAHAAEMGAYLEEKLDTFCAQTPGAVSHRGRGLIRGIVVDGDISAVIKKAQDEGLIVISAGGNVLRLLPPLIIEKEQIDEMIEKLKKCF
jgi:acetylornithine/N-succinyldiaminopimelate aminotransferase